MHLDNKNNIFIHETAAIDEQVVIGEHTRIWHFSHVLANSRIGKSCNIGQNVAVGPDVTIGNNCKIQNNVSIYKGVELEDDVFCGPSIVFTNVLNPRAHIRRMDEIRPTLVKKGASIGANATIVCGVTIGKYAMIGAGAVVTRDVPDHSLVVGNPAKHVGWMCECGEKLNKNMVCPACEKQYQNLKPEPDSENISIPFVDLAAQQKRIYPEIHGRIAAVLKHGKYIMGPEVKELEKRLAAFTGVKHALTCASGTDALIMVLMALGIGPGDAVFTTPFTFIATAEAIRLTGATPVFVDIAPGSFNLSPENLKMAILALKKEKKATLIPRAIIPVDLFGLPCDFDAINKIAANNNLYVVEDAAQSFGAFYNGKAACSLAHAGCTSFFPAKPLGCYGDGGAVFTDSDELAQKLLSIRIHGKGKNKYDNVRTGINGRLDTLQAAILLPKLDIFPEELEKRITAAQNYTRMLSPAEAQGNIRLPGLFTGYKSAWAQYSILADNENMRSRLLLQLKKKGIPTAVYYPTPLHLQTAFSDLDYKMGDFPVSENVASRIFSIPMHPYLTRQQQEKVAQAILSYNYGDSP